MAHNEQIFTPQYIVEDILDRVGYYIIGNNTSNIRKKHIIDNSCGNGAFLKVIVERKELFSENLKNLFAYKISQKKHCL